MGTMLGVHGYGFTGSAADLYAQWSASLGQLVTGLEWYSAAPGSFSAMIKAALSDCWDTYEYAYKILAPQAAEQLAKLGGDALIAHSLGSRVAIEAMSPALTFVPPRRVLLLEGACLQRDVPASLPDGVEVLNVCTRSDLVLRDLGSVFSGEGVDGCIGRDGLGRTMADWKDVFLDDPATIAAGHARGWNLRAIMPPVKPDLVDDLRALGDHWACYAWPGNWALFKAFLAGDPLDDFGAKPTMKVAA